MPASRVMPRIADVLETRPNLLRVHQGREKMHRARHHGARSCNGTYGYVSV
jgi:hypothetical protein